MNALKLTEYLSNNHECILTVLESLNYQQISYNTSHNAVSYTHLDVYKRQDVRLQNFGMVGNAYVRVLDEETGEELVRFDLSEDFSIETAVVVAELYKRDGEWKFKAVGSGYNGGLKSLCAQYGIDAE